MRWLGTAALLCIVGCGEAFRGSGSAGGTAGAATAASAAGSGGEAGSAQSAGGGKHGATGAGGSGGAGGGSTASSGGAGATASAGGASSGPGAGGAGGDGGAAAGGGGGGGEGPGGFGPASSSASASSSTASSTGAGGARECQSAEECSDDDPCDGEEVCSDGQCKEGPPPNLDDGNKCTIDACDTILGITHTPIDVDDGNSCTVDSCNPMTGMISHVKKLSCACAHSLCTKGDALDPVACSWGVGNDCASQVCAKDEYCCNQAWDSLCLDIVKEPEICPTGLPEQPAFTCNCAHSYCVVGAALQPGCDPCVKKICEVYPTCCGAQGGSWDVSCVAASHDVCNVPISPFCK